MTHQNLLRMLISTLKSRSDLHQNFCDYFSDKQADMFLSCINKYKEIRLKVSYGYIEVKYLLIFFVYLYWKHTIKTVCKTKKNVSVCSYLCMCMSNICISTSLEKEQPDVGRVSQESSQKVLELQRKIQTAREQVLSGVWKTQSILKTKLS